MKKKISIAIAVIVVATGLAACSDKNEQVEMQAMYTQTAKEAPIDASAEQAAVAVLKQVEEEHGSCGAVRLAEDEFNKITGMTGEEYLDVIAFDSEAKDGISNVFIIQPYPTLREDVRAKLLSYREGKVKEFENFDILDSYAIAKNSVIYDQGDYLVMLMLKDNDTAQEQVDAYIPQ